MERREIINILEHYEITFWTEGKNVSENTVNVQCPFCDDHSNHCGIFHPSGVYHCWRCTAKGPLVKLLSEITGLSQDQIEVFTSQRETSFKGDTQEIIRDIINGKEEVKKPTEKHKVKLPKHARRITKSTKSRLLDAFLERRNFSISQCIKYCCYICEAGEYMHRIIIPVFFNNELVSFQGVDMTGWANLKYRTAPGNINEYLYEYDTIKRDDILIVTEGVFDCWRVGDDSIASFGTSLTKTQKQLIIDKSPQILVFAWDADAWWKARKQAEEFKPHIRRIKALTLPFIASYNLEGHDPDSLGRTQTWELIEQAEEL
jgi:DNA primase